MSSAAGRDATQAKQRNAVADRAVAWSLPRSVTVGGVTSWSLESASRLTRLAHRAVIFDHAFVQTGPLTVSWPDMVERVSCSAVGEGFPKQNAKEYAAVLPAVFVPNFNGDPYADCAVLSRTHAERMRVIGFCHTFDEYYFRLLRYYEPIIHRFVAVSAECGERLRQLFRHRAGDIVVRPYGVRVHTDLDRSYSPPERPLQVIYAGRLVQEQKRVLRLIDLAHILDDRQVNFRLRVVGDGPQEQELQSRLAQSRASVQERVRLEESLTPQAIANELRECDVGVLVSDTEDTSVFMLEAMAEGCVPVVTRVSGTGGVIEHGVNGFCHEVDDLAAMADSIRRLDGDRTLLAAAGRAAHETARRHDIEDYAPWFGALVEQVGRDCGPWVWPAWRPLQPSSLGERISRVAVGIGKAIPWARPPWRWLLKQICRR